MAVGILFVFLGNSFGLPQAQPQDMRLPAPGVMVRLSPEFNPPILKGIKVYPDNPLRFDFILDVGDSSKSSLNGQVMNLPLQQESAKLIKYFLASLTIPDKDLWVNLSPYEKDRIIPHSFGLTEMGRDLLAQDYMLKQITASLIYPEDKVGKRFWERIYEEAARKFGTTNIPVNTFNKVWIVPQKAVVYENAKAQTAYVVESKLKVMLEQDYLSQSKNVEQTRGHVPEGAVSPSPIRNNISFLGSNIVREIIIPELTKEVNTAKNFAQLRQVYNSLILATWYKKKIKDSLLQQVYVDKNKIAGVGGPNDVQAIYQRYLQAFKKGVFNYIKEDAVPIPGMPSGGQGILSRKYFSGGTNLDLDGLLRTRSFLPENVSWDNAMIVQAQTEPVSNGLISHGLPVEDLIRDYEKRPANLLQATVYEFAGVGNKDVYNSVIFQAKIHSWDKHETNIIAGRVEERASEFSRVMFFQQRIDRKWYPIQNAPVFENSQDPAVKKIGDQLVVSMVKVEDRGEKLSSGLPRLVYYMDFFRSKTLDGLEGAKRIARGPLWMKDIRLLELKDGRILIMTRPQGDNYGGHYGPGKIAYLIVKDFREFIELAQGGEEGSDLAKMMEHGKALEGMFWADQWGGTNDLNLLENGKVGVLGHIARRDEKGNREYAPTTFEFDPETGEFSFLKIIGRWETLAKLLARDIPVKKPDPARPDDLANVYFGTTLVFFKDRYFLMGGARDTSTPLAETTAPFTSPLVNTTPLIVRMAERSFKRKNDKAPLVKPGYGGIDLTPANSILQTQSVGAKIYFNMDPSLFKQLQNTEGFVPVIINIEPIKDLRGFLTGFIS